jgi:RimJ/RimL family protein N-acetyltransferase
VTVLKAYPLPHEAPPTGFCAERAARLGAGLPRLETARCILRAPKIEDFPSFAGIFLSDRAKFMIGDQAMDRGRAWIEFAQCTAGWLLRGHGMWTIEAKTGGAVLGFVLILMEPGDREPELGWFLTEAAEGKGYAYEAARAARDFGIDTLQLPRLVSYVDPPNARSICLAERLGAVRDAAAEAEFDEPVLVFRHWPRDDAGGMEAYA